MNPVKRKLLQAWITKAKRDLLGAQQLAPNLPDLAIYHCQQAAEKALKSVFVLHDLEPSKTHNIDTLIREVSVFHPELSARLDEARYLSEYNQTYRYPNDPSEDLIPTPGELKKAFSVAINIYRDVTTILPQEVIGQRSNSSQQSNQQQPSKQQGPQQPKKQQSVDNELEL